MYNAERFMRARYDAEDYLTRPLPPVEVEVQGGTELQSVLEILRKYGPRLLTSTGFPRPDQGRPRHQGSGHFDDRSGRGGRGGGRGGRDGRRSFDQSRDRGRDFTPRPPQGPPPDSQQQHSSSNFNGSADSAALQRKISTYMDVDAPKVGIVHVYLYIDIYICMTCVCIYMTPKFCQNNGISVPEYSLQHWERKLDVCRHCFGVCQFPLLLVSLFACTCLSQIICLYVTNTSIVQYFL